MPANSKANSVILIPVKSLSGAKQRLAPVCDQASRSELARVMLVDVLEAVAAWSGRPEVSLVTGDSYAAQLAREFDFQVIADPCNAGETDAIEMATQLCETRGMESTLVIPADIPLVKAEELAELYAAAPVEGSVLVPASDGRGSNAIFRRPASLFPLCFGNDSFKPHLAAAQATGKACIVLSLPGIGLDVDNPGDLKQLAEASGETRSQRLVRKWGICETPLAANR